MFLTVFRILDQGKKWREQFSGLLLSSLSRKETVVPECSVYRIRIHKLTLLIHILQQKEQTISHLALTAEITDAIDRAHLSDSFSNNTWEDIGTIFEFYIQ